MFYEIDGNCFVQYYKDDNTETSLTKGTKILNSYVNEETMKPVKILLVFVASIKLPQPYNLVVNKGTNATKFKLYQRKAITFILFWKNS